MAFTKRPPSANQRRIFFRRPARQWGYFTFCRNPKRTNSQTLKVRSLVIRFKVPLDSEPSIPPQLPISFTDILAKQHKQAVYPKSAST